jgi:hypothetical protein
MPIWSEAGSRLQETMMKLILPFLRHKPRRKPTHMPLATDWATRDWADLPHHHPRRDER